MPIFHFYTPWKRQKTSGFLTCVCGRGVKKWSIAMKWISNLIDSTQNSFCRKDVLEIKDFIQIVLFYVKVGSICIFRNDHAEHVLPSIGKIRYQKLIVQKHGVSAKKIIWKELEVFLLSFKVQRKIHSSKFFAA